MFLSWLQWAFVIWDQHIEIWKSIHHNEFVKQNVPTQWSSFILALFGLYLFSAPCFNLKIDDLNPFVQCQTFSSYFLKNSTYTCDNEMASLYQNVVGHLPHKKIQKNIYSVTLLWILNKKYIKNYKFLPADLYISY